MFTESFRKLLKNLKSNENFDLNLPPKDFKLCKNSPSTQVLESRQTARDCHGPILESLMPLLGVSRGHFKHWLEMA